MENQDEQKKLEEEAMKKLSELGDEKRVRYRPLIYSKRLGRYVSSVSSTGIKNFRE